MKRNPPNPESDPPAHLLTRTLLLWVVVGLVLNFIWEILQRPLYAGLGSLEQGTWHCFLASLGDAGLLAGLYGLLCAVTRERYWFLRLSGGRLLLLAAGGFAVAAFIELHALKSGKWRYAPEMPRVPGLGVGWSPVLQMVLIPLALAWLSKAMTATRTAVSSRRRRH